MKDEVPLPIKQVNEHFYHLPKVDPSQIVENYRHVAIATLNESVQLVSSHSSETMDYLTEKALHILKQLIKESK